MKFEESSGKCFTGALALAPGLWKDALQREHREEGLARRRGGQARAVRLYGAVSSGLAEDTHSDG